MDIIKIEYMDTWYKVNNKGFALDVKNILEIIFPLGFFSEC